jgi:uncharacterized protein YjbI with pentapeptide repeats
MTRDQLLDALLALTPTQLQTLVYKLAVPRAILPGPAAPPATLIIEVLHWAELQGRLEDVVHVLADVSAPTSAFFSIGGNIAGRLSQEFVRTRKHRREALDELGRIVGPIDDTVRWYVEPNCQVTNPADHEDSTNIVITKPVFAEVDRFMASTRSSRAGGNNLIVLGDAGTGKTSLLVMLQLMHLNNWWPRRYECQLYKLGDDTLDRIRAISTPATTVLLLDSLDEDPKAWGGSLERFREILMATEIFFRTVVTCRTQYLPEHQDDPIRRDGWIKIDTFLCPAFYISPFTNKQVAHYLARRFPRRPFRWLPLLKHPKRNEAERIVPLMSSMRFRPMLLAHIEDFVNATRQFATEYEMYEQLIDAWLEREEQKARKLGRSHIRAKLLHTAVIILALRAQEDGLRVFSHDLVRSLGEKINAVYQIRDLDYALAGRSLITVSEDGYRFAHRSIQEFLVAQGCVFYAETIRQYEPNFRPRVSALLKNFLLQALAVRKIKSGTAQPIYASYFEFDERDLTGLDLSGSELSHTHMMGIFLAQSNLSRANLSTADLRGANLSKADLSSATLRNANLEQADLRGANLRSACLAGAKFVGAMVKGATMQESKLPNVDLSNQDFSEMDLTEGDFADADFRNSKLILANLKNAILVRSKLADADLSGANLAFADMTESDIQSANLSGANLQSTVLLGANLRYAKVDNATYNSQTVFPNGYDPIGLRKVD